MSEWKIISLGDYCVTNKSQYSAKENWNNFLYLDTGNITKGSIDVIQEYTSFKDLPSRARRKVENGDIVYSMVRPNLQHYGYISNPPKNLLVSTGFVVISPNKDYIDSLFLYYYLTQSHITNYLHAIGEQSVCTYPAIKPRDIENLEISLPPLPLQRRIAAILSSLDDKIACNQKICRNLEEQAQALFKDWFVDFTPFKNQPFIDTELGKIPMGWKVGTLGEIVNNVKTTTKKGENPNLPYLPIDSIPMNSFLINEVKDNSEAQSSLVLFKKSDILVGAMRVYFHRVIPAPFDGITRSTCFVLRPISDYYFSFALCYINSEQAIQYASKTSKGSTMPYAVWEGGLSSYEIIIPPSEIAKDFNHIVKNMIKVIQEKYFENQTLSALRDTLLPRLMSGEIAVLEGAEEVEK